jgi:hypothetical protein
MPLILAVEPERRQASQLKKLVRTVVGAELVLADTTEHALDAIGNRIPDLVLVPALLSPQDDEALATALRVIAAAAHVQTLTIPVFAATTASVSKKGGMLAKLGLGRAQSASLEGCDPVVFAEQIAAYLADAAAARALAEEDEQPALSAVVSVEPATEPVEAFEEEWQPVALAERDEVEWRPVALARQDEVETVDAQINVAPDPDALIVETDGLDLGAFVAELEQAQPEPIAALLIETAPLQEESEPEPDSVAESELWVASALSPRPAWPRLEGPIRPPALAAAPAAPPVEPAIAAKPVMPAPAAVAKPSVPAVAAAQSARPEWTAMLEALRHDIDRLRSERTEAAAHGARPMPAAAAAQRPAATPPSRRPENVATPDAAATTHAAPAVPRKKKRKKEQGQVQDEWGFFDPEQCGFTALLAKLDEISTTNDETLERP